jgi:hypothetical protein
MESSTRHHTISNRTVSESTALAFVAESCHHNAHRSGLLSSQRTSHSITKNLHNNGTLAKTRHDGPRVQDVLRCDHQDTHNSKQPASPNMAAPNHARPHVIPFQTYESLDPTDEVLYNGIRTVRERHAFLHWMHKILTSSPDDRKA